MITAEQAVLSAVLSGNLEEAQRRIKDFLPGEKVSLKAAAIVLYDITGGDVGGEEMDAAMTVLKRGRT